MTRRKVDERGVYAVRCGEGRSYVGGSNFIHSRWLRHRTRLRGRWHPNRLLQAAWDAQGEEAFTMVILELVGPDEDLIAAEQKWIDRLQSFGGGYNLAPRAGSSAGVVMSPESCARLSEVKRGKKQSAETNATRSASLKAFYSDPDRRRLLSLSMRGACAGERNSQAKITADDAATIRRLAAEGLTRREIGERFGITRHTVGSIVAGKTWNPRASFLAHSPGAPE